MVMNKTTTFGFPVPAYDYGAGDESTAVAEFTSSMSAGASAVLAAINIISNALSVEVANRISADAVIANNISVVSAAVAAPPTPNAVSAQLASVSAVFQGAIDVLSNIVSGLSNQVSIVSADGALMTKAINTGAQASISVSTCLTISGVSIPLTAGSNYYFKFVIPYTHKNLAGGITVGIAGPAMTAFAARVLLPTGGTATAMTYTYGTIGTIGGKISNISNALSSVTLIAIVEGFANPSATAGLHCVIGITVASTTATLRVLQGAQAQAWKLS